MSSASSSERACMGQSLLAADIPLPALIIDKAIAAQNCTRMLQAVSTLSSQHQGKVQFRAHIKTHKTTEISRLQVGDELKTPARWIASTLVEIEGLVPLAKEYKARGRDVNILYGVPLPPSSIPRLARAASAMGPGSISVMLDHEGQLPALSTFYQQTSFPAQAFIKVVTGPPRAGRKFGTAELESLVQAVAKAEQQPEPVVELLGFYSHAGDSYYGNGADDASTRLASEIEQTSAVADFAAGLYNQQRKDIVVAVGATPTTTALHNLLGPDTKDSAADKTLSRLSTAITSTTNAHILELHAGVYPLNDMQQLATNAQPHLSFSTIGITILAEVCSLYPERPEGPEAMIAAGCLALSRESCKAYDGWGIVSKWGGGGSESAALEEKSGWIVGRISQEHGILTREKGNEETTVPFEIGQKVRIFPNHACITAAPYKSFVVVDGEKDKDVICDVWTSWTGW